jgi:hypothetical protein
MSSSLLSNELELNESAELCCVPSFGGGLDLGGLDP